MTALVVEAERRGELPPTRISPCLPELQRQPPSLAEVTAAFRLYGLSRSIAACFCSQDLTFPDICPDEPYGDCHPRMDWLVAGDGWYDEGVSDDEWSDIWTRSPCEGLSRMPEWRARVSHAVFRLLIVGAALAGAYQEPLFRAREHPDPDIQALPQRAQVVPGNNDGISLTQKEMDFLLEFSVCDLDATLEAQDAIFGPIADWLLENILSDKAPRQAMAARFEERRGRAEYCLEEGGPDGDCALNILADGRGTHSDAHHVAWELMQMFWLVSRLRLWSRHGILDRNTPCPPSSQGADAGGSRWGPVPTESAVAVFFGVFKAEETLLKPIHGVPPGPQPSSYKYDGFYMKSYPAVPSTMEQGHGDGKAPCTAPSVVALFDYLFDHSGRPNHFDHASPVAPLEFKFFEYFLQRHLGACFLSYLFNPDEDFMSIDEFGYAATIFAHDDIEGRRQVQVHLTGAHFLDGSEILSRGPLPSDRFYQPRRV